MNKLFIIFSFMLPALADAKIQVIATLPDLGVLAQEVGGDAVTVESIAKGTQDPHFIEAKPSYMVKVSKADLLISAGLSLEIGWLPSLIQGARNPKVKAGEPGYLELGLNMDPLEVPQGNISRAGGDVHPDGNPHFYIDPIRLGKAAGLIADRLSQLDPSHAADFQGRATAFADRMKKKTEEWKKRIEKSGVKKVVSYHKTLTYFFNRFGLENVARLEPKPGIPPTSAHILEVVQVMKQQKVKLILVENFFDPTVTKKILGEVPDARSVTVPVDVGGESGINTNEELIERLVRAVEGK